MEYCLDIKRNSIFRKLEIISLLVLELVVFFLLVNDVRGLGHLFTIIYMGASFLSWADAYVMSRKYSVDSVGVTVYYPFGHIVKYKWNDFSQIAVCRVHLKTRSHKGKLVIRFTTQTEPNGPHNAVYANEKWASELYEVFHWKRVISVEYTADRYQELLKYCPNQILDFRYLKADFE